MCGEHDARKDPPPEYHGLAPRVWGTLLLYLIVFKRKIPPCFFYQLLRDFLLKKHTEFLHQMHCALGVKNNQIASILYSLP